MEGVDFFTKVMKQREYFAECFLAGLVIHPSQNWFGASPDWLVSLTDDKQQKEWTLLEVKTFDAKKSLSGLPYLRKSREELFLDTNHAHFYQVQERHDGDTYSVDFFCLLRV